MSMTETKRLWFERPAGKVSAGDFVIMNDSSGSHTRIVRRVVPDGNGQVVIHCWNGSGTVGHVFAPDQLIELV